MFQRRHPVPVLTRLRNLIWPAIGLRRLFQYYKRRLHRIPATPSQIAAGFAIGAAVSFSPLLGSHMVLAALLAWLTGVNVLSSLIGTYVINPWTGPPAWYATYYVGRLLEGMPVLGRANAPAFVAMFKGLTDSVLTLDGDLFAAKVWPVFKPMLLGSVPVGLAVGWISYAVLKPLLTGLRRRPVVPPPPLQH